MTQAPSTPRAGAGLRFLPHAVLLLIAAACTAGIFYLNRSLVLPSDDVYINLGLGRRFFEGTANGEFPSGTTAFGWSLVFGWLTNLIGERVLIVLLAINIAGAFWFISILARLLPARGATIPEAFFLLWAMLLINLPLLCLIGMEHIWHVAFLVAALAALVRVLNEGQTRDAHRLVAFILLAALCRQETMFFGLAVAVYLVACGRHGLAAGSVAAAFLPVTVQGVFQLAQGKSFLANPIAIKARMYDVTTLPGLDALVSQFLSGSLPMDVAASIAVATTLLFFLQLQPPSSRHLQACRATAAISILYAAAHCTFADVGWLGRYQAPIVACAVVPVALLFHVKSPPLPDGKRLARWFAVAALALGASWTAAANERFRALINLPRISWEVANQMCRIRDLVSYAPASEPVVLSDVGCTTFYLDNPIIDLYGLTSFDARQQGGKPRIRKDAISALARTRGARMAILYEASYRGRIPDEWIEIGRWTTGHRRYAANATVTLYATAPDAEAEVRGRWRRYRAAVGPVPDVSFEDDPPAAGPEHR